MYCKALAVAATVLMVAACSNLQEAPGEDMDERFYTEVTDQGLQQFTYTLRKRGASRNDVGPVLRQSGVDANRDGARGSRKDRQRFEEQVVAWMETQLADSGFCRHGYFLIDKDIALGEARIKGECKAVSRRAGAGL
ncbi:hypothetical protein [Exilibacterium tricleocarpae]|nr:hypothetical protein [Exilibacterium tricleocarpae]